MVKEPGSICYRAEISKFGIFAFFNTKICRKTEEFYDENFLVFIGKYANLEMSYKFCYPLMDQFLMLHDQKHNLKNKENQIYEYKIKTIFPCDSHKRRSSV